MSMEINYSGQHERPMVSVIMPAYNSEEYIQQAIDSVIQQTFRNWELIVIDDQSKDSTRRIVEELAKADPRIHLYVNARNCGAAASRNRGLDLCRGNYVALLDSDDIWYANKLETQLALAERENADIVYCSYAIIDERNQKYCKDFIVPATTTLRDSLKRSVISCSTALLRKNVVECYRFPQEYYHEDLVMWLQLLKNGMVAVGAPDVLAAYRVHSHSRASNKLQVAERRWKVYRSYMGMSRMESAYYFVQYAFMGFTKYRKNRECSQALAEEMQGCKK